ncbi:hypothetical protein NQZ79_g2498 [Umbelopsis isabellina]|nr:hypothetical protein NQZ79_g2498 [Umbelopsis isabellina]
MPCATAPGVSKTSFFAVLWFDRTLIYKVGRVFSIERISLSLRYTLGQIPMGSSVGDFVAAYIFLFMAILAGCLISFSAYFRPTPLRLSCLVNNVMTIAQAAITVAYCYEAASQKSICIFFFICRLGYVTLTAYEILKIGNRIKKNRSSLTRALLFWILAPTLVLYCIADIASIIVSGVSNEGYPPFWLYIVGSCLALALAGGCNIFAWAPIILHSYHEPVTRAVASAAIWYFVCLHMVVPGLIGQYIAIFALGNVWFQVAWICVEGCLRIIFGVIPPQFMLGPLVDYMQPKLQLQVISENSNGYGSSKSSSLAHLGSTAQRERAALTNVSEGGTSDIPLSQYAKY